MTQIDIVIRDNVLKLLLLVLNSSKNAEFTKITFKLQNYHFVLRDNILSLFSKITTRSYLHEFHECAIYTTI